MNFFFTLRLKKENEMKLKKKEKKVFSAFIFGSHHPCESKRRGNLEKEKKKKKSLKRRFISAACVRIV